MKVRVADGDGRRVSRAKLESGELSPGLPVTASVVVAGTKVEIPTTAASVSSLTDPPYRSSSRSDNPRLESDVARVLAAAEVPPEHVRAAVMVGTALSACGVEPTEAWEKALVAGLQRSPTVGEQVAGHPAAMSAEALYRLGAQSAYSERGDLDRRRRTVDDEAERLQVRLDDVQKRYPRPRLTRAEVNEKMSGDHVTAYGALRAEEDQGRRVRDRQVEALQERAAWLKADEEDLVEQFIQAGVSTADARERARKEAWENAVRSGSHDWMTSNAELLKASRRWEEAEASARLEYLEEVFAEEASRITDPKDRNEFRRLYRQRNRLLVESAALARRREYEEDLGWENELYRAARMLTGE